MAPTLVPVTPVCLVCLLRMFLADTHDEQPAVVTSIAGHIAEVHPDPQAFTAERIALEQQLWAEYELTIVEFFAEFAAAVAERDKRRARPQVVQ